MTYLNNKQNFNSILTTVEGYPPVNYAMCVTTKFYSWENSGCACTTSPNHNGQYEWKYENNQVNNLIINSINDNTLTLTINEHSLPPLNKIIHTDKYLVSVTCSDESDHGIPYPFNKDCHAAPGYGRTEVNITMEADGWGCGYAEASEI